MFFKRNASVSARTATNGAVLYHADRAAEKAINETGLLVWSCADGSLTPDGIAAKLGEACDGLDPAQALNDTRLFLHELAQEGWVDQATSASTPTPGPHYVSIKGAPRDIDLSLTGRCNLRCAYCFYANEMQVRPDRSTEEWLTFFRELGQLGVRSATLSGGEVFLRPDLWALVDGLVENRMRFCFLSNGTLLTETTAAQLLVPARYQRLNHIQVSIDGSCARVHDASRGAGSFDKATRAVRLLCEARIPCTCRVTLNRHNIDDLEAVARLLLEDLRFPSFSTNEAIPMGSGCLNQGDTGLTTLHQIKAMRTLEQLTRRYPGRITATAGPLSKLGQYREMERARATGEKPLTWRMGALSACGGVFNKIAVHHDGTLAACSMLPGVELGQMNRSSLADVWQHHPQLKGLRDRQFLHMRDLEECRDCEWVDFCNGSCPSMAWERTGGFNVANMEDCYRRFRAAIPASELESLFIQPALAKPAGRADG